MKKVRQIQSQTIKDVLTNKLDASEIKIMLIENTLSYLQRVSADETASTASRLTAIKQQWAYSRWIEKYASQEPLQEDIEPEYPTLSLKFRGS